MSTDQLIDRLAEEFTRLHRQGANPSAEEYARRYPHLADELLTVLPAAAAMERMKPRTHVVGIDPAQPATLDPREAPPEFIGEYRILRIVGRGGMGVVYEARHEALGRTVAVKVLSTHLGSDPTSRTRFFVEAQAAAKLHHTNIVPVFAVGEYLDQCYYVMQYIPSRGLDQVIDDAAYPHHDTSRHHTARHDRQLPPTDPIAPDQARTAVFTPEQIPPTDLPRRVARMGLQVAEALAHAHAQGVIHRDIKPSNLLLDNEGTVWVTDFGLAKLVGGGDLTPSGGVMGTLRYMPPERFEGRSEERGDVYSLGLTLFELLSGRPAFEDDSADKMIERITQQGPVALDGIDPSVPRDLATIVRKAAAPQPDQRYAGAKEMAEDLRRFLEDRPILARRAGLVRRLRRWTRRDPYLAASLGFALLMLVGIAVVSFVAYRVTANAKVEADRARDREKESAKQALDALNRIFASYAPTRFVVTSGDSNDGGELARRTLPPGGIAVLESLSETYAGVARTAEGFDPFSHRGAEARFRLGEICQRLGDADRAVEAFRESIRQYEQLLPVRPQYRVDLARAHNGLGLALRYQQKFNEAKSAFEKAAELLTEATDETPKGRSELAFAYFQLDRPNFFGKGGALDPAKRPPDLKDKGPKPKKDGKGPPPKTGGKGPLETPPVSRARPILEELLRDDPGNREYEFLLACCPDTPFQKSIDLLTSLANRHRDVPDYRLQLAETLNGSGQRWEEPPSPERAERAIQEAETLIELYPTVPEYRFARARFLDKISFSANMDGDYATAEEYGRKAVTAQKELVDKHPQVLLYAVWLSLMERTYAEALTGAGKLREAWGLLQASIERMEKRFAENPQMVGVGEVLRQACFEAADVLEALGEKEQAEEMRRKAAAINAKP